MKEIGAKLLVKTVAGLADGSLKEQPQSNIQNLKSEILKHAPKIFTETCKIDFTKTTAEVHNLIRGLSPFPGAFTELNGKMLKIFRAEKSGTIVQAAGSSPAFETDGKTYLYFACSDGFISVKELQLEGKKKMSVTDFLKGYHFE